MKTPKDPQKRGRTSPRRTWSIKPFCRVKGSGKTYDRKRVKKIFKALCPRNPVQDVYS